MISSFNREPESSHVYKVGKAIAGQRPDRLYLEWTNRQSSARQNRHSATILHHGIVQTAKFLGDMTKFVTSNGDGQIKVRVQCKCG